MTKKGDFEATALRDLVVQVQPDWAADSLKHQIVGVLTNKNYRQLFMKSEFPNSTNNLFPMKNQTHCVWTLSNSKKLSLNDFIEKSQLCV